MVDEERKPRTLRHAGSNTMNYAIVMAIPDTKRGVLVAANAAAPKTQKAIGALVKELAEAQLETPTPE